MSIDSTFTPKQTYKNRAEAYRLFVAAQKLPVGQTKFYNDSERLGMINPDKSIDLSSLLSYVKCELQVDPATGNSLSQKVATEYSDRKLKAEVDKAEADARTARMRADEAERSVDSKWMLREESEDNEAALAGFIKDAFRHRVHLDHVELIQACEGNQVKASQFIHSLQAFCDRAFNDVARYKEIDLEFENEENDDHEFTA